MNIITKKIENSNLFEKLFGEDFLKPSEENNLKQFYHNHALKYIEENENFVKSLTTHNIKKNETYEHKFDFKQIQRHNYLWVMFNVNKLNNEEIEKGNIPFFHTSTLSSKYHRMKIKNNKLIKNNKYDSSLSIKDGYDVLNRYHRELYKNFSVKKDGKYIKIPIKFFIAFENHKDFTCHSHALYYIPKEYIRQFERHIKKVSAYVGTGKSKDSKVLKPNPKTGKIDAIAYIAKYLSKNQNPENEDLSFFGWKHYNKIRAFRFSKISNINRMIFNKISKMAKITINEQNHEQMLKEYGTLNVLEIYEQITNIKIITILENEEEKITEYKVKHPIYEVEIKRKRTKNKKNKEVKKPIHNILQNYLNLREIYLKMGEKKLLEEDSKIKRLIVKELEKNENKINFMNFLIDYEEDYKILSNIMFNKIPDFVSYYLEFISETIKMPTEYSYKILEYKIYEHKMNIKKEKPQVFENPENRYEGIVYYEYFEVESEKIKIYDKEDFITLKNGILI